MFNDPAGQGQRRVCYFTGTFNHAPYQKGQFRRPDTENIQSKRVSPAGGLRYRRRKGGDGGFIRVMMHIPDKIRAVFKLRRVKQGGEHRTG